MASSSTKKVKTSFTNTKGQKVTSYTDGTKKVSGNVTNTARVGDTVNGQKVRAVVGGNAYASGKDTPGYSDEFQGKGTTSSGTDIFGSVITADNLKRNPTINLPTPAPVDGMYGVTDTATAGLAGSMGGTYDPKTKQMTPPTGDELFKSYQDANAAAFNDIPSSEERLKAQQKMLRPKENLVNSLAGQLNTITANRDAEMLGLEGQGRGVTESIIGGQQAQISREAAIRAMPIQAQLAIAQDDLESARSYASQLFQAQSQDAQNLYNYRKELNASIYSYLDGKEKARLAQNEKALDRQFAVEQSNRSTLKSLSMQAIEYGQGALAGEIMRLDPTSSTFDADYADVTSRLYKPVAASSSSTAGSVVTTDGRELVKVTPKEIQDLNDTQIAKNSLVALADSMIASIEKKGTKVLWGAEAGARDSAKTNLLLAMKNLEKTGALDKGTIDVLSGTIPGNTFFATEAAQIAALKGLRDTVTGKVDEYVGSYRGTTAEIDPRTARIYEAATPVNVADDDLMDIESIFTASQSTASISPAAFY